MKRKLKFPLIMKDEIEVRSISELREHFDMEKVIQYFLNGKLKTWLNDRGYNEELDKINDIEENDEKLNETLCEVIGVNYENHKINISVDEIKEIYISRPILEEDYDINELTDDIVINIKEKSYIIEKLSEYICRKYGDHRLGKYSDELNFIDTIYDEIQNKFICLKESLNDDNIFNKFDILEDILVTVRNRDVNTNRLFVLIYKLPLDIKVKFIYILLGDVDQELDNLSIDEAAGFYIVFERVLSLQKHDFIELYTSNFSLKQASVSIRNRDIFSKYLDSKYHIC